MRSIHLMVKLFALNFSPIAPNDQEGFGVSKCIFSAKCNSKKKNLIAFGNDEQHHFFQKQLCFKTYLTHPQRSLLVMFMMQPVFCIHKGNITIVINCRLGEEREAHLSLDLVVCTSWVLLNISYLTNKRGLSIC